MITDFTPKLIEAANFFFFTALELLILFVGITFLVSLLLQYISAERIQKTLSGRRRGIANVLATIFGGLTPFCSCSAIPVMMGLLDLGVPFGAVMSFLIASPIGILNPVVLTLFATLFGLNITIAYIVTGFFGALIAGFVLDSMGLASYVKKVAATGAGTKNSTSCCAPPATPPSCCAPADTKASCCGISETPQIQGGCCATSSAQPGIASATLLNRIKIAGKSATQLFRNMFLYLLAGVAIGAIIYGFIPAELLAGMAGPGNPFAVPIAAAIGVPMYARTETIIPIGFALVQKGVSVGALMALVIGGAGASLPELAMLAGIFKRRLWIAYVITVFSMATIIGYLFNMLF